MMLRRALTQLPITVASGGTWRSSAPAASGAVRAFAASSGGNEQPVYLVFGAAGSIGSALSQRLVAGRYGTPAAVVLTDAADDRLQQLKQKLQGPVSVMPADATKAEEVDRIVDQVLQKHGRIDAIANCVGNVVAQSTLATDVSDLEAVLRVNLYSAFNVVKAGVKAMLREEAQQQKSGALVLVSAALASHGIANYEAMSAAKAAVEGLARSSAATYANKGIRVNCVAPGLTDTRQTEKFIKNDKVEASSEQMHPMKRLGDAQDVAAALEFLMSPDAQFITGQVLAVDGGLSTLHPHHAADYGV